MEQYLNFVWTRFLISVLVFVSHEYELGRVSHFGGVDRQSRTGLIFIQFYDCLANDMVNAGSYVIHMFKE